MKKSAIAALALLAAAAPALSQNVKPENQIKFRRAAYTIMNLNFSSLEAMVENKKPFNKDEAVRNADIVSLLSLAAYQRSVSWSGYVRRAAAGVKPRSFSPSAGLIGLQAGLQFAEAAIVAADQPLRRTPIAQTATVQLEPVAHADE